MVTWWLLSKYPSRPIPVFRTSASLGIAVLENNIKRTREFSICQKAMLYYLIMHHSTVKSIRSEHHFKWMYICSSAHKWCWFNFFFHFLLQVSIYYKSLFITIIILYKLESQTASAQYWCNIHDPPRQSKYTCTCVTSTGF